ncbi:MAG: hypothetical protein K0U68_11360 [Gammaproteobacteria bacterium]|nr:hypothetical protein [Gammaproteobacteria bacterium]
MNPDLPMEPMIQEDMTGCAIASAAAIAGIGYRKARVIANRVGSRLTIPCYGLIRSTCVPC